QGSLAQPGRRGGRLGSSAETGIYVASYVDWNALALLRGPSKGCNVWAYILMKPHDGSKEKLWLTDHRGQPRNQEGRRLLTARQTCESRTVTAAHRCKSGLRRW